MEPEQPHLSPREGHVPSPQEEWPPRSGSAYYTLRRRLPTPRRGVYISRAGAERSQRGRDSLTAVARLLTACFLSLLTANSCKPVLLCRECSGIRRSWSLPPAQANRLTRFVSTVALDGSDEIVTAPANVSYAVRPPPQVPRAETRSTTATIAHSERCAKARIDHEALPKPSATALASQRPGVEVVGRAALSAAAARVFPVGAIVSPNARTSRTTETRASGAHPPAHVPWRPERRHELSLS